MKKLMVLLLLTVGFILVGCETEPNVERYNRNFIGVFDSIISVSVWYAEDDINIDEIFNDIDEMLWNIHKMSTKYDLYDGVVNIKTINENPGIAHPVDEHLITMLEMSIEAYNDPLMNGSFNVALGSVLNIWSQYRNNCLDNEVCEIPSTTELHAAAEFINPNDIVIDNDANTVLIPEGMQLDLGGVAKGYGAELVGVYLRNTNAVAFMVNAGSSNIEFFGDNPNPNRDYWTIGLKNPDNPNATYATIAVEAGWNIVTSGDYERFYVVDGVEYHHIINPETLFPSWHIRAVTVVSKNPALGDIYSTAAFVLPLEDAIAFINSLEDVEAIWFDEDDVIHYSENFEAQFLYNRD